MPARIILEPDADVRCKAGVRGSAEALCGVANIERLARLAYRREDVSAREVIEASRAGDALAGQVMAQIGGHAGHLLALLSPIFFPQRILITGGTAEAGDPLFEAARRRYDSADRRLHDHSRRSWTPARSARLRSRRLPWGRKRR